ADVRPSSRRHRPPVGEPAAPPAAGSCDTPRSLSHTRQPPPSASLVSSFALPLFRSIYQLTNLPIYQLTNLPISYRDQSGCSFFPPLVICRRARPSRAIVNTCFLPERVDVNAMCRPLGAKAGLSFVPSPNVS